MEERAMPTQLDMYKMSQHEIVRQYEGQIIAVKDGKVLGAYPSKTEALDAMCERFAPGSFLVIKCTPGDKEYTLRFRSRSIFHRERAV